MSTHLEWYEIALRLALTIAAGALIGANRGGHGHAAGLRTVMLVCLAASISMIQANLLLGTVGKSPDSFIVLDLMRLPLGILSGMGFIGGGSFEVKWRALPTDSAAPSFLAELARRPDVVKVEWEVKPA